MVVSIDKATALRMHDKVRKHWQAERARVEAEISRLTRFGTKSDPDRLRHLQQRFEVLTTTDMALIVSPAMRVRRRKHIALHRGPAPVPVGPTERWSMDFVHDALADGRRSASSPWSINGVARVRS